MDVIKFNMVGRKLSIFYVFFLFKMLLILWMILEVFSNVFFIELNFCIILRLLENGIDWFLLMLLC